MTKIVAIGVGSLVFGVELLRDVYQTEELRGAELWLVDLDPEALRRMGGLAAALNEASGWDVTLRTTPERTEALAGADFVVTSIARDRDNTWKTDHALALKHGFPSEALVLVTQRRLERMGYVVTGCSDPRQALEIFRAHPMEFDAIMTDVSMPHLPGAELAQSVLQIRPDLPVIMASGYVRPEDQAAAARLGIREVASASY